MARAKGQTAIAEYRGHTVSAILKNASPVYDSFWHLAAERQRIYRARVFAEPPPWTSDSVLGSYRFTNAYRSADRVSQYLIRRVIYTENGTCPYGLPDTLFRILLFKVFNRIETWEALQESLGEITLQNFLPRQCAELLTCRREQGIPIFSAAYVMPTAPGSHGPKHAGWLEMLARLADSRFADTIQGHCQSLGDLYAHLNRVPGIGPFLAYQYAIDLNYSPHVDFSENDFIQAGPGARSGLRKCFGRDIPPEFESALIAEVCARQGDEFQKRGIDFADLWGRPLQCIDIQNLFCEVDKYARIVHPHIVGVGLRSRIKQRFTPTGDGLKIERPFFPPKWGINGRVDADYSAGGRVV